MTKGQAQQLARQIERDGMIDVQAREWDTGSYDVTYTDPKTGYSATVTSHEQYDDKVRASKLSPYLD